MTIRKADRVVAGAAELNNVKPLQEFIEKSIGIFTEDQWETMVETEKVQYKMALIYTEVSL